MVHRRERRGPLLLAHPPAALQPAGTEDPRVAEVVDEAGHHRRRAQLGIAVQLEEQLATQARHEVVEGDAVRPQRLADDVEVPAPAEPVPVQPPGSRLVAVDEQDAHVGSEAQRAQHRQRGYQLRAHVDDDDTALRLGELGE